MAEYYVKSVRVIPFAGVTRKFFLKIFLRCAQLFKSVEVGESMRADDYMRLEMEQNKWQ